MGFASQLALNSSCYRSRCGSVIVKQGEIIGQGYNSPPAHETLDHCLKDELPADFKSDRTCCVHAEQRAIIDALKHHAAKVDGSTLYFIRLNDQGSAEKAGKPYCTICSKMALDSGIAEFVLWHEEGLTAYNTKEYNQLSFGFRV